MKDIKDKLESLKEQQEMFKNHRDTTRHSYSRSCMFKFCERMPRKWIISYKNKRRAQWDLIPMMLSIYNAFLIPYQIGIGLPLHFNTANSFIDLFLDILFLIDNSLMFFTSFQSKHGLEVKCPYEIYLNYTRTWRFVFDSVSLLGSSVFTRIHASFKYAQLLKAMRVLRIGKMIHRNKSQRSVKTMLTIAKLVFYLLMYNHWMACIWNLATMRNGPPIYGVQDDGTFVSNEGELLLNER